MESIDPKTLLQWRTRLLQALLADDLTDFFAVYVRFGLEELDYTFSKAHDLSLDKLFVSYLIAPYGNKSSIIYQIFAERQAFIHAEQGMLALTGQEFRAMGYSDLIHIDLFKILITQSPAVKNNPQVLGLFLSNYFKPRFVPPFDGPIRKPTDPRETAEQAIKRALPIWNICGDLGFTPADFNKESFKADDPFLVLLNSYA